MLKALRKLAVKFDYFADLVQVMAIGRFENEVLCKAHGTTEMKSWAVMANSIVTFQRKVHHRISTL